MLETLLRAATGIGLALGLLLLDTSVVTAADRGDRLDRFRELAASRLALAQIDADTPADAYREIYAVFDDEIVESLASGGPFASLEFLQDRLDGFADVWGGAVLRVVRAGGLLVGAFVLDERSAGNSVRVYGRLAGEGPALLTALSREGRPSISVLPGSRDGAFVVAWEGTPAGWGTRPLRIELLHRVGDGVRVAWSTADVFTDGLQARSWSVRGGEVRIRYEVRYPGWVPGCAGQTEQEDVYRLTAAPTVTRVSRLEHDAWHRELHATLDRLLAALAARDEGTLLALVPDRALRGGLPPTLRREPGCDAREGAAGDVVSVAAAADREPLALTFRRQGVRWRLTGTTRVLQ
jgi:hypothetical protein